MGGRFCLFFPHIFPTSIIFSTRVHLTRDTYGIECNENYINFATLPRRSLIKTVGWDFYILKRLLDVLFLLLRNFATFRYCQDQSNGRCLWVCCFVALVFYRCDCAYRRGLLRCSFYNTGRAKASKRGTSNNARFHAFLHIEVYPLISKV